jgi:hypothetical protein
MEAPPPSGAPAAGAAAPVRRRPLPPAGRLRRHRRALLRVREERIRDLGGLVLEMYRRDAYRRDLVEERCLELAELEERLQELDTLLAAAASTRRTAPTARCVCGATILWGARFCASCGRTLAGATAIACPSCGHPLAADAHFCPACGHSVVPLDVAEPAAGALAEGPGGEV